MRATTSAKVLINRLLRPLNAQVDTLTRQRGEDARLQHLAERQYFERPVYPIPAALARMDAAPVLAAAKAAGAALAGFATPADGSARYTLDNMYFTSPDAEVLYGAIGLYRPRRIVEVGSGNSTKLMRQALTDLKIDAELYAIDPSPRTEIVGLVDRFWRSPVEDVPQDELAALLRPGDMLLIDSSHQIRVGNDVVYLYLNVLPQLPPGVLVHIHDIFLPYEYPERFVREYRWDWTEHYLVQAMLAAGDRYEVLWAGHYLQRTLPDFDAYFPLRAGRHASSLLLRTNA